jgi:hypothetical protein
MPGGSVPRDTAGTRSPRPGIPDRRPHARPRDMTRHRAGRGWTLHGPAVHLRLTRLIGAAPGSEVKYPCDQRIRRDGSHSQMEGFQAWDRHNLLPHIGPSATALN